MNVIVADSRKHAQALIGWLRLDPDRWAPVAFGEEIEEIYHLAKIVRPLGGVTEAHLAWMTTELMPMVIDQIETLPDQWRPVDRQEAVSLAAACAG